MARVQGIVLHPSKESFDNFQKEIGEFIAHSNNIWRAPTPHLSLVLYSLPKEKNRRSKE